MISGKILKNHGWKQGRAIGLAKAAAAALADADAGLDRDAILARLDAVRKDPAAYLDDPILEPLATELDRSAREEAERTETPQLHAQPLPYRVWGEEGIDQAARAQMEAAMRLPITVAGALMPDAHVGYGLPIGGVLATHETVIPYAVGVDIACFTGDTKIPLLNGEERALKELADEEEEIAVYVCTPSGRVKAARARAYKTREVASLVEVTIDNGEHIRCTPDHEFMLRDGTYCTAQNLPIGTSLMPLYRRQDKYGYTLVQQPYSGRWQKAHWVVARSGLCGEIPKLPGQRVIIHHRDFHETNNDPSNLEFMGHKDHSSYHRSLVERNTAWHSQDFERRRVAALSAKAKTPEGHAYFAQRGLRNIEKALATKREAMIENWERAGQRGREHLIRKNQSEAGRRKSREMANHYYPCETCGEMVKSYIGLHNHRRLVHGYNHQIVSVQPLTEREAVYCLHVPEYENFALSAGVFVHNCRMRLSIYPESPDVLDRDPRRYEQALLRKTYFGAGKKNPDKPQHEVLDDPAWSDTKLLRGLHDLAAQQLGTSGSGNHFVEWGSIELIEPDPRLGLEPGMYLALLSHSGSRGVGFKIANTYSQIAMDKHRTLDHSVRHLAWLSLEGEAGQEYWHAMELAGRFASANHYVIHHAVAKAAHLREVAVVENHHNFAFRERVVDPDGQVLEAIVHRKGATPAGKGVFGVIPGSMGDPGFVVRGRGVPASLESAAHGAGRAMGRKAAMGSISRAERDRYLQEHGVTLLGGGLDEAPQAYKRIQDVIAAQQELIDIVGRFRPRIVRMANEPGVD